MPSINIDEETTIFTMDFAKTKGLWPQPAPTPRAQPATADRDPSISSDPLPPIGGVPGFNEGGSAGEFDKRPQGGAGGATIANAKVFTAEGVLKEALRKVVEQAKSAKLDTVSPTYLSRIVQRRPVANLTRLSLVEPDPSAHPD
jgi:hypothetical protein